MAFCLKELHHAAHASAWSTCHWVFFFLLVSNQRLGGQYHCCNGSCILQCGTGNLGWVNDTSRNHINIGLVVSIVAVANFADRKSTRLNSSHVSISYAVFCLK